MKYRIISLSLCLSMLASPALVAATTPRTIGLSASSPMPCVAAPMNDVAATASVPQRLSCWAAKAARIAACTYYGEASAECIAAKIAEAVACAPRLPPGGGGGDDEDPDCPEGSIPKHIAGSDVCCYEYSEIWEDGILVVECDTNPN
ncbi:MAG: hypothetical protein OXH51_00010 [Gemmatimonadetes bacterium]|nr:hypothetical protein [Gemmatimonadota bacterium]